MAKGRKNNTESLRYKYAQISYVARKQYQRLVERVPAAHSVSRYSLADFPTLEELGDVSELDLARDYAFIKKVVNSGQLSLQKNRRIISTALQTIRINMPGQDFINEENAVDLFNFLSDARDAGLETVYGYREILQEVSRAQKAGLTPEQIRLNMEYYRDRKAVADAKAVQKGKQPVYQQLDFSTWKAGRQRNINAANPTPKPKRKRARKRRKSKR